MFPLVLTHEYDMEAGLARWRMLQQRMGWVLVVIVGTILAATLMLLLMTRRQRQLSGPAATVGHGDQYHGKRGDHPPMIGDRCSGSTAPLPG